MLNRELGFKTIIKGHTQETTVYLGDTRKFMKDPSPNFKKVCLGGGVFLYRQKRENLRI